MMRIAGPLTVVVDRASGGGWDVGLPGQRERVSCTTLDQARQAAELVIARRQAYKMVIRDAYFRVVARELIDRDLESARGPMPETIDPTSATG